MVNKAYPGTISSVILSVLVVIIMLVPLYTANHLEGVRNGEGTYDFQEGIVFDINNVNQFDNTYISDYTETVPETIPYPPGLGIVGQGAFFARWERRYHYSYITHSLVNVRDTPIIDGTVDNYAFAITQNTHTYESSMPDMYFVLNTKWEEFVDSDVTAIDIFVDGVPEREVITFHVSLIIPNSGHGAYHSNAVLRAIDVPLGEKTRIEVTVDDLLEANLHRDEQILICIRGQYPLRPIVDPGAEIIFDMQWYHIEEIKIITIDYIGIAMAGGGIFMIFCSILMLPTVEFSGVMGRIVGKRS